MGLPLIVVFDERISEPAVLTEVVEIEVDHLHPRAGVDEDLPIPLADEARAVAMPYDERMHASSAVQRPRAAIVEAMCEFKDLVA